MFNFGFLKSIVLLIMILSLAWPAMATRKEGVNGRVETVNSDHITVAGKTYRFGKQLRVIIVTFSGIHRSEKEGNKYDIRVGDKVYSVVMYDEMTDIYLERY